MPTIADYLSACDRMANDNRYVYDNSGRRCNVNGFGRDCSTFVAFALNEAGYPGINLCNNSFGFAAQCFSQPRPDWFTARFGPGQGTFITHQQALGVVCWGLEGNDYARRPTSNGGGHIETSLGNGGGSVGAHSHATGIGYSQLDWHNCNWFAVPPMFLGEMEPATVDWDALARLARWQQHVQHKALRYGDRGPDIQLLNDLLVLRGYLKSSGDRYGKYTWTAVNRFKKDHGWTLHTPSITGGWFGGAAATELLK